MASNYKYIINQGLIVPDTSDLQTQVEDEYKAAFGADLVTTPDTPQGVLITTETLARAAVVANNAAIANQINPNVAEGVFLDAICALTGLQRQQATFSRVTCQFTGSAGAVVPPSVIVANSAGDQFSPITSVTLSALGTGEVECQALVAGDISIPANSINTIVVGVLGLATVNNSAAGVSGTSTQSDQSLRNLRNETLAKQGVALPASGISALKSAGIGVTSVSFYENYTNVPIVTPDGAVPLVAHSVYYCVDGGSDTNVATVLQAKKSLGCAWNGGVSVNITDAITGQIYVVQFDRPTYVPILVQVTVGLTSAFVGDAVKAVKSAILDYVNGNLSDEPGLQIGTPVSTFELAGAINREYPGIFVSNLLIKKSTDPLFSAATIPILINERATIVESSIAVTVL